MPLNSLVLGVEALSSSKQNNILSDGMLDSLISTMRESAKLMSETLSDVLSINSIEEGKLELTMLPFSLKSLLERARLIVKQSASEKQLEVSTAMAIDLESEFVRGDKQRLLQVISTLLENSIKASPVGHDVLVKVFNEAKDSKQATPKRVMLSASRLFSTVGLNPSKSNLDLLEQGRAAEANDVNFVTRSRSRSQPHVTMAAAVGSIAAVGDPRKWTPFLSSSSTPLADNDKTTAVAAPSLPKSKTRLCIAICDQAPNLTQDQIQQLFTPSFNQLRSQNMQDDQGSGLGMVLARNIIELHGGTLTCKSKMGEQGNEYTILLPLELMGEEDIDDDSIAIASRAIEDKNAKKKKKKEKLRHKVTALVRMPSFSDSRDLPRENEAEHLMQEIEMEDSNIHSVSDLASLHDAQSFGVASEDAMAASSPRRGRGEEDALGDDCASSEEEGAWIAGAWTAFHENPKEDLVSDGEHVRSGQLSISSESQVSLGVSIASESSLFRKVTAKATSLADTLLHALSPRMDAEPQINALIIDGNNVVN